MTPWATHVMYCRRCRYITVDSLYWCKKRGAIHNSADGHKAYVLTIEDAEAGKDGEPIRDVIRLEV